MSTTPNHDVSAAFEILLEAVEAEVTLLNTQGEEAFRKRDYTAVKNLANTAEQLTRFRSKILGLSTEWEELFSSTTSKRPPVPPPPSSKRDLGRLHKGTRTPEASFYFPILQSVVELGGSAEMAKVLDRVYKAIGHQLRPVDLEHLPSGPKTNLRWRNTAQWARNTLKEQGFLRSDSAHGMWEITDAGRSYLQKSGLKALSTLNPQLSTRSNASPS